MSVATYRTGDDVVLEFVGQRFHFSRGDFEARAEEAARRLGLVGPVPLPRADRAELGTLAGSGVAGRSATRFSRALAGHVEALEERGEDVVYWLRKLIFRAAWLDQRVRAGLVEAVFDERDGSFAYWSDRFELPLAHGDDVPSWPPVLADR